MDRSLKERLVGAAVLVGLAVWLIPWVLDGPVPGAEFGAAQLPASENEAPLRTQTIRLDQGRVAASRTGAVDAIDAVPAASSMSARDVNREQDSTTTMEMPGAPVPEPVVASTATAVSTGDSAAMSAATTDDVPPGASAEASDTRAALAPQAPAPGWVVQLGSFRDGENARRLADRVSALGYTANVSTYRAGGGVMYRVRVGPEPNRESAADIASSLIEQGVFPAQVVSSH